MTDFEARMDEAQRPFLEDFRTFHAGLQNRSDVFYMFFTSGLLHWASKTLATVPEGINVVAISARLTPEEAAWASTNLPCPFFHLGLDADDKTVWEFLFDVADANFGWLDGATARTAGPESLDTLAMRSTLLHGGPSGSYRQTEQPAGITGCEAIGSHPRLETRTMRRNPLLLVLALAAQSTSACRPDSDWQRTWGEDPPPRFFKSYDRGVRFEIPRIWRSRFEAFEAHGARAAERQAGAKHVLEFRYVPLDGEYRPETMSDRFAKVVTLYAFSAREGERIEKESPALGTVVARARGEVWIAVLPASNPFPPGSADARRFGEMLLTADQIAQRLHIG